MAQALVIKGIHRLKFESKFVRGKKDECWIWRGSIASSGYGKAYVDSRTVSAHRLAYYFHYGHFTTNQTCHTCDTPACVNPYHLADGTQSENMWDAVKKGRHKTIFVKGHKRSLE